VEDKVVLVLETQSTETGEKRSVSTPTLVTEVVNSVLALVELVGLVATTPTEETMICKVDVEEDLVVNMDKADPVAMDKATTTATSDDKTRVTADIHQALPMEALVVMVAQMTTILGLINTLSLNTKEDQTTTTECFSTQRPSLDDTSSRLEITLTSTRTT